MATLTEVVAAVVVHSSAAAFSHFGVTLDAPVVERPTPAAERVIARSPRKPQKVIVKTAVATGAVDCPETQRALKA